MKKSLLALAALGAFASVASAQSSVTLFGIVDLSLRNASSTGAGSTQTMAQDGYNSSRLGVRGVEDIGGGLKAGFHLEGAINPDTGTPGGQTWQRRSTVSLMGGFGEVRLGRDYTPSFWNYTVFDAFGTNGVGSATNVNKENNQTTFVRANNSVGYFLPSNLGGLYGQVMIAAPEGNNNGKYFGGRVGYGAGPFNAAVAIGQQNAVAPKYKTTNIGLSYDFGFAKAMFMWAQEKNSASIPKETHMNLGLTAPVGAGELRASFNRADVANSTGDASQLAVGYVHNLSKRTALYGTFSRLTNKGGVAGGSRLTNNGLTPTAGGKATGVEVGVRHSF